MSIRKNVSTIILAVTLLGLSLVSLFMGATDITLSSLLSGQDAMQWEIFILGRIPRLLAIICTGVGMSVVPLSCLP